MFVVGGLYSLSNGVAGIMRDLAAALGRHGTAVEVFAADCYGRGAASVGEIFQSPTRWNSGKGLWLGGLSWSPGTRRLIEEAAERMDVIHNHSLWMLPNHYASRAARHARKPVLFTAHGTLEPWALGHSGWKKRIVAGWFQRRDLESASCLHVNSARERDGIRRLGLRQPVAVIPNGVDMASLEIPGSVDVFLDQFPHLRGRRLIVFMARLHRKKGLQHLLEAWKGLAREFAEWHLVVAGPDCGVEGEAREYVAAHALTSSVTLTGPLYGAAKSGALQAAEAFALPSFSEGFSMSILEGLAAGCPVLMTPGCNFPEAVQEGVAVEVQPDAVSTASGLRLLLELSDAERETKSTACRNFVLRGYTWDSVARRTLDVYRYLIAGGPRPDCLEVA